MARKPSKNKGSSNAPASRSQKDAKKRIEIIEALNTLMMQGAHFSEISVADIVTEAGISRSTFYLHFSGKDALIEALITQFQGELIEASTIADDMFTYPSRDTIRLTLINLARIYRKNVALFRAINEAAATSQELNTRYHDMICFTVTARDSLMRKHKRAGLIRKDVGKSVPLAVTWMVERAISQHITAETKPGITNDKAAMSILDALAEVLWCTLYPAEQK